MSRFSARRLWLFVRYASLLDRVVFGILLVCIAIRLARTLGAPLPFETLPGFVAFATVIYFVIRLIPWIRRRVLWSLRNRLIVAYIFMAVVPVVLLLTMVGVSLYLLELQIGAHLLRDDIRDRLTAIESNADAIAAVLNREPSLKADASVPDAVPAAVDPILSRPNVANLIVPAQTQWPELQVFVNAGRQLVATGNGKRFSGLAQFRGRLYFAAAETLQAPAGPATVLLVAPVTTAALNAFPSKLGPIQLTLLEPAAGLPSSPSPFDINGKSYILGQQLASSKRLLAPAANWLDVRVDGVATLEAYRADVGTDAVELPVLARFSLRSSVINGDLLTSVGAVGPFLVFILAISGVIFVLIEGAALATGTVLTRTITRSVADLYDGTLHVRRGDFIHRIQVPQNDQLGALGDSFNEMTSSISTLIESQHEKQRLEHEVQIAREVQQQLFPHTIPIIPGVDLAAIWQPARVVSGDYYDFIPLGNGRVGIAIADISGKGIFASLLMASLQAVLRSSATLGGPAEIVSRVNKHLFWNTSDDRYATFFYSVYDSQAKTLTYTNAGQLDPFFMANGSIQALGAGGTVVGLFEDAVYTECTIPVSPGTLLVAFSDGLTEAESAYGEEYGTERLRLEVLRQRDGSAARVARNLVAAAEQWSGTPVEQADDITIVVARIG